MKKLSCMIPIQKYKEEMKKIASLYFNYEVPFIDEALD